MHPIQNFNPREEVPQAIADNHALDKHLDYMNGWSKKGLIQIVDDAKSIYEYETGRALPWNVAKQGPWVNYSNRVNEDRKDEMVMTAARVSGWIKAAANEPMLVKLLSEATSPRGMNSQKTVADIYAIAKKTNSPGQAVHMMKKIRQRANQILEPYGLNVSWKGLAVGLEHSGAVGKAARAASAATVGQMLGYGTNVYKSTWQIDMLSKGRGMKAFLEASANARTCARLILHNGSVSTIGAATGLAQQLETIAKANGTSLPLEHLSLLAIPDQLQAAKILASCDLYQGIHRFQEFCYDLTNNCIGDIALRASYLSTHPTKVTNADFIGLKSTLGSSAYAQFEKLLAQNLQQAYDRGDIMTSECAQAMNRLNIPNSLDVNVYGKPITMPSPGNLKPTSRVHSPTYMAKQDGRIAVFSQNHCHLGSLADLKVLPNSVFPLENQIPVLFQTQNMKSPQFGMTVGDNAMATGVVIATAAFTPKNNSDVSLVSVPMSTSKMECAPILHRDADGRMQCIHPGSDAYSKALADFRTSHNTFKYPQQEFGRYYNCSCKVSDETRHLVSRMVEAYCKATEHVKAAGKAVVEHSKSKNEDGGLAA